MPQAVIGLVAHVDAGKTTLAEALLYRAGAIRRQGRVDKGDAHLDTDAMERERGITIFSKQTYLDWAGAHLMLLDTPGHVDFSAEAERTLQALDYAVLIVGANDGIEGHTETLWGLLDRYRVPTFLFVNKLDLAGGELAPLMAELRGRLSPSIVDGGALADLAGLARRRRRRATARPRMASPARASCWRTSPPPTRPRSTSTSRAARSVRARSAASSPSAGCFPASPGPPCAARGSRGCSTASPRSSRRRRGRRRSRRASTA